MLQDASSFCDNMTSLTDADIWGKLKGKPEGYRRIPNLQLVLCLNFLGTMHPYLEGHGLPRNCCDHGCDVSLRSPSLGLMQLSCSYAGALCSFRIPCPTNDLQLLYDVTGDWNQETRVRRTCILASWFPWGIPEFKIWQPPLGLGRVVNQKDLSQAWDKEGYSIACGSRGNYQGILAGGEGMVGAFLARAWQYREGMGL